MYSRRNKKLSSFLPLSKSSKKKAKKEKPCITWTNLALGALIPLSIGVGTVVLTILQQHVDSNRQNQERELDDRRYYLEQDQTDELHFQNVFKIYIEDISNVLFKSNQSASFLNNKMKMNYVRIKTLTALEDLNWEHKTRLFLFLYENGILPNNSIYTPNLSRANFMNIFIDGLPFRSFQFNNLHLQSTLLTGASFIGCDFNNGTDFGYSIMNGIDFKYSRFSWKIDHNESSSLGQPINSFDGSKMQQTDFTGAFLCDITFNNADLSHSKFNYVWFQGNLQFIGVNLTNTSFRIAQISLPLRVTFFNADLRYALFNKLIMDREARGELTMHNVIHPEGLWKIDNNSLVLNGNAEINVGLFLYLKFIHFLRFSFSANLH